MMLYALLAIFLVHLVAFSVLALRRRQPYYLALIVTFALLSVAIAVRIWWPDLDFGDRPVHETLRQLALLAAAVSITWTLVRLVRRSLKTGAGAD